MRPNTKFIITVPFNNRKFRPERLTKEWIEHRMEIFMNTGYKSLMSQTNQQYEAVVFYDIESENEIKTALKPFEPLADNVYFMDVKTGVNYIKESLKGYDYLCYTKMDTDNMYHESYIQYLYDYMPKEESHCLAFTKGYSYNAFTGEMAKYIARREYFYTQLYTTKEYLEGARRKFPIGGEESAKNIPHELIEDREMFMIMCHDSNVNNTVNLVKSREAVVSMEERIDIWSQFTHNKELFYLKK